jgi:hypothetical protein
MPAGGGGSRLLLARGRARPAALRGQQHVGDGQGDRALPLSLRRPRSHRAGQGLADGYLALVAGDARNRPEEP